MTDEEKEAREAAAESLRLIQNFDVARLPRVDELGRGLNFSDVVVPAQRLVDLFRRLTPTALDDFPLNNVQGIRKQADAAYLFFDQILQFESGGANNPANVRDGLINSVTSAYDQYFPGLHPFIAYSLHRSADFQRLDTEARATLQAIKDEAAGLTKQLAGAKGEAEKILEDIRAVAAEQGVTQQALYFKEEAESHDAMAGKWETTTRRLAWALFGYAFLTLGLHKIPWLAPTTTHDSVQLAVSKVLMFSVITYMLYLAARNFLSHTHNAIINRHRENALKTYKALVDAAGDTSNREAVLIHAAACIFSPQPTGYDSKDASAGPSARSVVELLTKPMSPGDKA